MNSENFQYLSDHLKYMGFGENLKEPLEQNMNEGKAGFQLHYTHEANKKKFEAILTFRKSDVSSMYFLNSYHASLQRTNGEKMDQVFYLDKGKGITVKEAYNMLEGRSVFKELTTRDGQHYNAWVQLDFDKRDKNNNHEVKQFHENYGYDLKAALSQFTIGELSDPEKAKGLLQSLQKGNIQSVSMEREGSLIKMFVEANPKYKTVNLYDAAMKKVQKKELNQYSSVQQALGKEVKQDQQMEMKQEGGKKVNQNRREDVEGLKNRSSGKKGLSV